MTLDLPEGVVDRAIERKYSLDQAKQIEDLADKSAPDPSALPCPKGIAIKPVLKMNRIVNLRALTQRRHRDRTIPGPIRFDDRSRSCAAIFAA
jgi:hypothetical protein